ncbi:MAG: hypothetical protein FWG02_06090 [Holophagaceae bacterium]|nr:hypothetical protein [Holophagaceae bacterium]
MTVEHPDSKLPDTCMVALSAIQSDPLELPSSVLDHISICPKCSEARVMWLAQEDFEYQIAPPGYFEKLPGRILQKLPVSPSRLSFRIPLLASAASLLLLTGISGYWYGRQSHQTTVVLEALVPAPKNIQDPFNLDFTSFTSIELFSKVESMTPEETKELMNGLKKPEANMQPTTLSEGD